MSRLTSEETDLYVDEIMELSHQLNVFKPTSTLQSLERFENQLTLNELEACFFSSGPEKLDANLIHLLSVRWERIRNSNMCYTQQPTNLVNQLCLALAKAISPATTKESEIAALAPKTGPYCLLMPSLETSVDIYRDNIHSLGLHEFVLSDNERAFIPVGQCLHQASESDEGQFRHMVEIDGGYPELTPSEVERVSHHSKQASELYQAVAALNKQRLLGNDIGAKLSQLVVALRSGGSHSGRGSGSELNAGAEANEGIIAFNDYWSALPERQKLAIFTETPELKNILGRLFRPEDVDYQEVSFCVELLAEALDTIIQRYNKNPIIQTLIERVLKQESAFKTGAQSRKGLAIIPKETFPKHILPLIFKLTKDEQKKIFKQQKYENALIYALEFEPGVLPEFELDKTSKQQAVSVRFNTNGDTALIVAAKQGKTDAIKLLHSWHADLESRDLNRNTALHWAAAKGHAGTVACLLDHGALLDTLGSDRNNAMNYAVREGNGTVVDLLLKNNAQINARNSKGENALDLAIAVHPEFIDPILMQMALLPLAAQAEGLRTVRGGPYPNVLFYAVAKKPALFGALVDRVLQQPNKEFSRAVLKASNEKGYSALILAAQMGAHDSISKLLASGLNIESHDLNRSTALHWAAAKGHADTVACLLNHDALLEARGADRNTALSFAVREGKGTVVDLLLKNNAQISSRNSKGESALDLAIAAHPEFIDSILMQMALLPLAQQAECLLRVSGGPYPSVLFYAAANKPALFDTLVDRVLQQPNKKLSRAVLEASNEKGYSALILAAQMGAHDSISKLLASGLSIESHDLNRSTVLHWAANNGRVDAATVLLDNGAMLEARGFENNTALNFAVMHGKGAVIDLLLKRNAKVNVRNKNKMNALDLAIAKHPEFIDSIIMQMVLLPLAEQAECLLRVPGGPYSSVLFYAAAKKPALFDTLVDGVLQQPNSLLMLKLSNKTKEGNVSTAHVASILTNMHFDEHLELMFSHYQQMKEKSHSNSNYTAAVSVAKALIIECVKAKVTLYQSEEDIDKRVAAFKNTCFNSIEAAKPVLTKYREWGKVLAALLLVVITLPVSLTCYAMGFFSIKTKSEQLLDDFQQEVINEDVVKANLD